MAATSAPAREHLDRIRAHYDAAPPALPAAARGYRRLLAETFNRLIPRGSSVLEIGCGNGELLARLDVPQRAGLELSPVQAATAQARLPDAAITVGAGEDFVPTTRYDALLVSDTLNLAADVQGMLGNLHRAAHAETRLIVNFHNTLWRPFLWCARVVGLKRREPENSWLAKSDVLNLLRLSGWEPVRREARILCPLPIPLLAPVANHWLAPLLPDFCLTIFIVARPAPPAPAASVSVSVVIPARNEAGNIDAVVRRTPEMGASTELILVEGGSSDGTWDAIQQAIRDHPTRNIRALRQTGRGKGDAVRTGFAAATGDLLMILDADLSTPPEDLPKFHDALATGRAELANGSRLVYPLADRAMPFLNLCVNKAFSLAFSWVLGQPVKDTLCGTKALSRAAYARIAAQREYFGDFDPFGDFDLLFGAARLGLRIADVPVRYQSRTYGSTNIHRWRDGWLLLRMLAFAARKLRFS